MVFNLTKGLPRRLAILVSKKYNTGIIAKNRLAVIIFFLVDTVDFSKIAITKASKNTKATCGRSTAKSKKQTKHRNGYFAIYKWYGKNA